MPPIEFTDWCNQNENSSYPISLAASRLSTKGELLPENIICDANVRFPETAGKYAVISSVCVSDHIVSVTLVAIDYQPGESPVGTTAPLGSVTLPKPVDLYRNYPISPITEGVGGWMMFGRGAEGPNIDWISKDPTAGFLNAKANRCYRTLPFQSLSVTGEASATLMNIIGIFAGTNMVVEPETRNIDGENKLCLVLSTDPDMSLDQTRSLIGKCASLAEQGECVPPVVRTINNVPPDENGNITITAKPGGDADLRTDINALLIDSFIDLSDHCDNRRRLPDDCGNLPYPVYDPCTPGRWDWCTSEVPK